MVLPPPAAHHEPRSGEAGWLDKLKRSLELTRAGVLLLVDRARPELLGELVRALLERHPLLEVHTEVERVLTAPHGSTLVFMPRAEQADWLNLNRPAFAERALRVILFCDETTSVALARQAVDFFDWISHRVECPSRPPGFAVAGLRCALAERVPGVVWKGGDLEAALAAARPRARLRYLSAARPYAELLAAIREHRQDWLAWRDVDDAYRLRRVRWALAEARHRTRTLLVEPALESPGWRTVHGRVADLREARERLEKAGARSPGRLAALCELEWEAIGLLASLLEQGLDEARLEGALRRGVDPGAELGRLAEERAVVSARELELGRAPPALARAHAFGDGRAMRQRREEALARVRRQLLDGQPVDKADAAAWAAWTAKALPAERIGVLAPELQAYAVEALLRGRALLGATEWHLLGGWAMLSSGVDVAEAWALRAVQARAPDSTLLLARVRRVQHRYAEAESLLREAMEEGGLRGDESSSLVAPFYELALVFRDQGRLGEAEAVFRQADEGLLEARRSEGVGLLHQGLASILRLQGRYVEAEDLLRQLLSAQRQMSEVEWIHVVLSKFELALAVSQQGRYVEAEALLREALEEVGEDAQGFYRRLLVELAAMRSQQGAHGEAERILREVLAIEEDALGAQQSALGDGVEWLSEVLRRQGRYAEAESVLRRVLEVRERLVGVESPLYRRALELLAANVFSQGRYAEAESLFRRTLLLKESASSSLVHPSLGPLLANLGLALLFQQGRAAEAEPFLIRSLEVLQHQFGVEHPEVAQVLSLLAQAQFKAGSPEARQTARRALEALNASLGPGDPLSQRITPHLQSILSGTEPATSE